MSTFIFMHAVSGATKIPLWCNRFACQDLVKFMREKYGDYYPIFSRRRGVRG